MTESAPQLQHKYTRTTYIYCIGVFALSLFVNITAQNNKDHVWMTICVATSLIPLAVVAPALWFWVKPARTYFFILGLCVGVIPLLIAGRYLMDFAVDSLFKDYLEFGPSFWRDRGGLRHYVNNIHGAFVLTCLLCLPYFFTIALLRETQLRLKRGIIIGFWLLWVGTLTLAFYYMLANSLN